MTANKIKDFFEIKTIIAQDIKSTMESMDVNLSSVTTEELDKKFTRLVQLQLKIEYTDVQIDELIDSLDDEDKITFKKLLRNQYENVETSEYAFLHEVLKNYATLIKELIALNKRLAEAFEVERKKAQKNIQLVKKLKESKSYGSDIPPMPRLSIRV